MPNLKMIIATDIDFNIGKDNNLIFHFKKDLKRFKSLTEKCNIIMGANTWNSLPKKPLPKRTNIVLSRSKKIDDFEVRPDYVFNSKEEVLKHIKNKKTWIIGGSQIYEMFIDDVNTLELSVAHTTINDADTNVSFLKEKLKEFEFSNKDSSIENETITNTLMLLTYYTLKK